MMDGTKAALEAHVVARVERSDLSTPASMAAMTGQMGVGPAKAGRTAPAARAGQDDEALEAGAQRSWDLARDIIRLALESGCSRGQILTAILAAIGGGMAMAGADMSRYALAAAVPAGSA